jgi:RNA methyltransferase, TrmH family
LRRLIRRRDARLAEGVVIVEGPNALSEAIAGGSSIREVYVDAGTRFDDLVDQLSPPTRVFSLAPGVMAKVADTVTPQALLAIVEYPARALSSVLTQGVASTGFIVIGVDIRDPGNLGTMIRSAEASGASGVLLCSGCVDVTSPKVVRSTAGALFHVPVVANAGPSSDVLSQAAAAGVRLIGTTADRPGAVSIDDLSLLGPVGFVMSNEAHGLEPTEEAAIGQFVTIPMVGRTESLNVAMATSVLVFEAARQRRSALG